MRGARDAGGWAPGRRRLLPWLKSTSSHSGNWFAAPLHLCTCYWVPASAQGPPTAARACRGADEDRSGTAWDNKLGSIKKLDLSGKPVACFGLGDSSNYGDYYCDAIEEVRAGRTRGGWHAQRSWADRKTGGNLRKRPSNEKQFDLTASAKLGKRCASTARSNKWCQP